MIRATQYWEKVIVEEGLPFGRRVLRGEYVPKSTWRFAGTLAEMVEHLHDHDRMTIYRDKIVENEGKQWGIHSYIEYREEPS